MRSSRSRSRSVPFGATTTRTTTTTGRTTRGISLSTKTPGSSRGHQTPSSRYHGPQHDHHHHHRHPRNRARLAIIEPVATLLLGCQPQSGLAEPTENQSTSSASNLSHSSKNNTVATTTGIVWYRSAKTARAKQSSKLPEPPPFIRLRQTKDWLLRQRKCRGGVHTQNPQPDSKDLEVPMQTDETRN